ncbi:ROK family transcriptional regulator [Arthrobacter sp. MYb211]|uniref:ROK family transcriptional regulator n=1 Tax=Micrococcaceae TaxID=1268 RepID=UPI000BB989A2|nr:MULTISPECIES: ROK family transcriptional regulator [Micrococcaceae]PCC27947.1 transcriptional regulator [Glutamicibacter sp. BW80]PRA13286.1 ROK family transcriptional regulator [Arthrobacter sp. MYb221]PRC10483.1 ROK family transcriptional regulator [Arthrobacter sp. MYb211]
MTASPRASKAVQSPETMRRNNLSVILTLLHREGRLSRAQLTERTGFNRSTVGALVAELCELGLVFESEPQAAGRAGRPSPLVHPNDKVVAVAINPDIDAVHVGLVGLGGKVHRRIRYEAAAKPTPVETANISKAILDGMRADIDVLDRIVAVGVAVPALVQDSDGKILLAPHLQWANESLSSLLEPALGLPLLVGNDATLGSVAESIHGAAQGYANVLYLNGSASGIGGGILTGGAPLRGASGFAGELGHTLVRTGGVLCHCGRRGCLDAEVRVESLLDILQFDSADLDSLEQAIAGNESAQLHQEIDRQIDLLSVALTNFVNIFNPEMIVLGGFLGTIYAMRAERLTDAVSSGPIAGLGREVRIRKAVLGSDLLLIGAAELAFARLLSDPAGYRAADQTP